MCGRHSTCWAALSDRSENSTESPLTERLRAAQGLLQDARTGTGDSSDPKELDWRETKAQIYTANSHKPLEIKLSQTTARIKIVNCNKKKNGT